MGFSNHDVVRAASRWHWQGDGFSHDPRLSKLLIALLGCLRGTIFLYQGEELGLPEAKLAFEDLQDPWGKHLWPEWQGRDGCRTPIPWHAGEQNEQNWLPVPDSHVCLNVDAQEKEASSLLNFTRHYIHWRKSQNVLKFGDIDFQDKENKHVLVFTRSYEGQTVQCLFNLSDEEQVYRGKTYAAYAFEIEGYSFSG